MVEKGVLYLRSWVRHVVYVELVGAEAVILGRVFPDESSEFHWVISVVPVVEHGDEKALLEAVAHGDGLPRVKSGGVRRSGLCSIRR